MKIYLVLFSYFFPSILTVNLDYFDDFDYNYSESGNEAIDYEYGGNHVILYLIFNGANINNYHIITLIFTSCRHFTFPG